MVRSKSKDKIRKEAASKKASSAKTSASKKTAPEPPTKNQKRPHVDDKPLISNKKRRLDQQNPWKKVWKVTDGRSNHRHQCAQNPNSNKSVTSEKNKSRAQPAIKPNNVVNEQTYREEYIKRLECLEKYGKNFYCPAVKQRTGLRPVYIDGSNVAFSHGQKEKFSVEGLKICIDYFKNRGHEVKAFVPNFRLRKGETTNQKLLHSLVREKLVITTPTLFIQNQLRSPYDDWYIVQSAAANGGIIVSSDNFQDIVNWNPNLRPVVEERRLVPTFVDDMIIFPVDPHGNRKNNLEQFLRF